MKICQTRELYVPIFQLFSLTFFFCFFLFNSFFYLVFVLLFLFQKKKQITQIQCKQLELNLEITINVLMEEILKETNKI